MVRSILVVLFALALGGCVLAAGAGQPRPAEPPEAVARAFVTALGGWDEPTLRRLLIPTATTEILLAAEGSAWRGWVRDPLGPQTSVEITDVIVAPPRATVVARSRHQAGEAGVRLALVQAEDGAWRVESWHSYRP